jgi:hypothetical protein
VWWFAEFCQESQVSGKFRIAESNSAIVQVVFSDAVADRVFDDALVRVVADLAWQLDRRGTVLPVPDLLIE